MKSFVLAATLSSLAIAAQAATPDGGKKHAQTVKGNVSITTTMSNSHVLMPGDGKVQLAIDLEATDSASGKRLPMNIALVIDRSGSMRGQKMAQTIQAAMHLVKQLGENDTLAIVSYSDDVRVDLPASRVTKEVLKDAMAAIEKIQAGGSTNLSGGLFRGQDEVQRNLKNGQVNRVILMSDGLANRGVTDTKQLSQQVQKVAQRGVSVTTMGVGTDYHEDLMTAVADHASGNYYFIEKAEQISAVFGRELKKMFATVAQSAQVKIRLEDGIDLEHVFGYTFTRKGDDVTIPLAEMFAGQKRSILVEVKVPLVREGRTAVAAVSLAYEDIARNSKITKASMDLAVRVTKSKAIVDAGEDKSVQERIEEVRVAAVMTKAADLLRSGRPEEARRVLREQRAKTAGRAAAMGGSARMDKQLRQLDDLDDEFEAAGDAPAKAEATIKKTKAAARQQAR